MQTIYALSSGRPPAAIAVIRISGPDAHSAASRLCNSLPEARMATVRALRTPNGGERLDEALVVRFDGPNTATGEDLVEFHCHGGRAVIDAVLGALGGLPDVRQAEPGEFTRRAFESGRIDLTEAEGLADLLEAETESQRRAAMALADGGLRKEIATWQGRALVLSAAAEQAIDYDEDDAALDGELLAGCRTLADELEGWLERPRVEPLKDGVRVVLAGPPNAGKSSLLNAIAGFERAIVSDVEGTTRDHIELPLSLNGIPVVLTDTAGIRAGGDRIEALGIARAEQLIESSDVVVWLGDAQDAPQHPTLLLVQPKADVAPPSEPARLRVSAHTGEGIATLMTAVEKRARALLPSDGLALNRRQAAEVQVAANALRCAAEGADFVIIAEELRTARLAFDRLTGRAGIEDVLDVLFARFCLGK